PDATTQNDLNAIASVSAQTTASVNVRPRKIPERWESPGSNKPSGHAPIANASSRSRQNRESSFPRSPPVSSPTRNQQVNPANERKRMDNATLIAGGMEKINRLLLSQLPVPAATSTHKPIAHHTIVEALIETLGFRK